MAVVREDAAEDGRADESGGESLAVVFDLLDEGGDEAGAERFGDEIEVQGQRMRRLRVDGAAAGRREVFLQEGGLHLLEQLGVDGGVLLLAQGFGGLERQFDGAGVVGGGDEVGGGGADAVLGVLEVVEGQPVGEVEAGLPEADAAVLVVLPLDVAHPFLHGDVLAAEQRGVAVVRVDRPGQHGGHVAPGAGAVALALGDPGHERGDGVGHAAVVDGLFEEQVVHELRVERGAVHVEAGGAGEDLRVARPAEALVALRAVRGHVEEVAFLAPERVREEAVDEGVRGLDRAGAFEVGVDDERLEVRGVHRFGESLELDVAEAVEREMRADGADAAVGGERVLGLGGAEVVAVEIALLEDFADLEAPGGARGRAVDDFDPSRELLFEIEDGLAGRGLDHFGRQRLLDADGRREAVGQRSGGAGLRRELARGGPVAGDAAVRRPAGDFAAGVVVLAVVDLAAQDGGGGAEPGGVGDREQGVLAAGLGAHFAGDADRRPEGARAAPSHAAAIPSPADVEGQGVLAGAQERRDVEGLDLDLLRVGVVAGQQHFVRRRLAVDFDLEDAERGAVDADVGRLVDRERLAHEEGRAAVAKGRRDPAGRPGFAPLAGFECRDGGGLFVLGGDDGDAPEVADAGLEGDAGVEGE